MASHPAWEADEADATTGHAHHLAGSIMSHLNKIILLRLLPNFLRQLPQLPLPDHPDIRKQQDKQRLHLLLGHHQDPLDQETLHDLRADALEQSQKAFVLDDVRHDLAEGLEGLALALGRGAGLQADFGDDEGLGRDGGEHFGEGAEHYGWG